MMLRIYTSQLQHKPGQRFLLSLLSTCFILNLVINEVFFKHKTLMMH